MNFIVSSTLLLSHLQTASRVINSKNTLKILDDFLFTLEGNKLTITASDIETTMVTTFEVDSASGDGKIAIEAKRLTSILKEFPEQPLTFNIDDNTKGIDIVSENGKFSIVGANGEDFPEQQELKEETCEVSLTSDALLQGVSKTIFATSSDELRPSMTGILTEIFPGKIKFVASDAHKLVCYSRTDIQAESENSFILPQKPANLLKNILPKDETTVNLSFDKKNAIFKFNGYKLMCRLIDGAFPKYQSIIPNEAPHKLTIDRADFCNCIRRVSACSNQASNLIKLSITANELTVSAQDYDFSISAHERVKCQYEGEEMEIGFKSTFLVEILSNLNGNEVVINLSDATKPGTFTPLDSESIDEEVLMLLMSMNLDKYA